MANGFDYKVLSFNAYDVNGYRFHTTRYEQSRPNPRTTNTGVFTPGTDQEEYYGTVEEIYELDYRGSKALNPVIFKCQWFDPAVSRKSHQLGIVKTRQDFFYPGEDVYIVAQQATQVYYCPYACKTDRRLQGWYIVHTVSPHGRLPRPNPNDYNLNPNTHDGEFYQQEEGLPGMLEIDLTREIKMEADEEWVVDEDAANEVHDPKDLEMLNRLRLGNDNDEDEAVEDLDNLDSDDDTYRLDNPDHEEY